MSNPTKSPTMSPKPAIKPIQSSLLDFPTAMKMVADGKIVTKIEWRNPNIICFLDGHLMIQIEGVKHDWIVSDGDMLGKDWIVLDPWPPDPKMWENFISAFHTPPATSDNLRSSSETENHHE